MRQLSKLFRVLGNERRLRILTLLERGPRTVDSIAENLKLSVKSTSKHLLRLEEAGLVGREAKGRYVYYKPKHLTMKKLLTIERLCR
ncbi:hypothetical protein A3H10_04230 [Candidatus Uhrbacteria bacterium RIFCSPLOWO2_12_FULL_46_10]|uniref:HTH arsR-type domain-containing protein n=1 Tax=Candidatus Uhrbacteria bacterium RIFCSPLOWO2_01_FULL_47_25 TaxID=1802402 RepID=A0A1F7UYJ5_9BACT|nr:MAG: Transcriptional regulator, ArsR family [Parcubacteria group bacterium GW2011_GWA2_46_9]OGL60775.1 MAG: hypothetical protein A2752_03495 [Candidatus Uhrbacteria bacterium RIFCSPHIGHO2_01_FULL_46_23]OGL70077.1 MAG: hypothetical protein A3D60_03370 [Candidatus Uhrbacteria bacterium RIFCSPHIGHO2_02_FULL_47_29]OGL75973.1 MAG: hypothetical protein A3E96_01935 [Candidatus Uhrbacteria bacterium RIFCSPHIGHO2_12_FULL_46_13]OGL82838.1 MAG: hypothetical protein A2936_04195 [Candidatus Uhrbacteria b